MSDKEWLESLKEGDEVAMESGFRGVKITTVTNRTKCFVTAENQRFSLKTGLTAGAGWNRNRIWKPTEDDRREMRRADNIMAIRDFTDNAMLASDEHLQQVADLIRELEGET